MTTLWPWADPGVHALMLLAAVAWDRWLGEPPTRVHPVVWMGTGVRFLRRHAPDAPLPALLWGTAMVLGLTALSAAAAALVQLPWVGAALGIWLLTSCFSIQGLVEAGERMLPGLHAEDLERARARLSWLCSRDPEKLDLTELAASATASVAENTSDSLVAPLFWYAVAGLPGILAYRCINTMDAMVGYRGPMEWLGKPAARLDDLANLVPARLTAVALLAASSTVHGLDLRRGLQILRRDRARTPSPNGGWPMATAAGLLGVRLPKPGVYVLGDELGPCTPAALKGMCQLARRTMTGVALLLIAALLAACMAT